MRKIRTGDLVAVIAGKDFISKAAPKTGKVLRVIADGRKVVVEGINLAKHHEKANQQNREGGIVTKPAPLDISNVALVSPTTGKPVRVSFKMVTAADGSQKKVRYSRQTDEILDQI
jgi:large subunit ribosomal protein L24